MSGGRIAQLRLRAPSGYLAAAQTRIEDAMRLADTDDRLLLLRRLDLGRMRPDTSAAQWARHTAELVHAQRVRAVHAMTPGAAFADAVWFRSADEAWTLLLLELAAGRAPSAWFWRLAVRDWNGASLRVWLPQLIAAALWDPPRDVTLARAIMRAVATGALDVIVAALAAVPLPGPATGSGVVASAGDASQAAASRRRIEEQARRLLLLLDSVVRATVLRYTAAPSSHAPSAAAWIIRSAIVAVAPELIAHPAQLAALSDVVVAIALAAEQSERPVADVAATDLGTPRRSDPARQHKVLHPADILLERKTGPPDAEPVARTNADPVHAPDHRAPATAPRVADMAPRSDERISAVAGLFLLVRPLVLLGLPGWLERHPELAVDGFARALLRGIAQRFRAADDDPVFNMLGPADDTVASDDVTAWRVGLDRWLRRRAGIKLAEVVRRRGWITASDAAVAVRFRVDTAELRLRRLALDADPGWVPFLGLTLRYHYRDDPVA